MKKLFGLIILAVMIGASLPAQQTWAALCPNDGGYGEVFISGAAADVESAGKHVIWTRMQTDDPINNSYLLEVNGVSCFRVGDSPSIKTNEWNWIAYQNGNSGDKIEYNFLSKTGNSFKLIGIEPNVKIDRLLLLPASNACIPEGTGDNCGRPVVSIQEKSEQKQSPITRNLGTLSGVAKVSEADPRNVVSQIYYINGEKLITYSQLTPFDTTLVGNGAHKLDIRTFYSNGSTVFESTQLTVENPLTTFGPVVRYIRLNAPTIRLAIAVIGSILVFSIFFSMLRQYLLNRRARKFHGL